MSTETTIIGLLTFYVVFVVIRDGGLVAYRLWAFYHNRIRRPYMSKRGVLIQYASIPPYRWMRRA